MSYQEIEYIQGDGSQYIDLGFKLTQDHKVDIKFMVSGDSAVFGSRDHANSHNIAIAHSVGDGVVIDFNNGSCETYRVIQSISATSAYRVVNGKDGRYIYDADDNLLSSNTTVCNHTITTPGNAYLMYMSYNANGWGKANGRIYYCKIYYKDELVYDIIPVLDADGVACVYDKVTDAYFYNQGSGAFVAGPIVEEPETPDEPEISDLMPVMTDVNAFFDARAGVTDSIWKNQTGDIDFELFNPIKNADGVEVVGSDTSYGKFTKPYVSGSSRTWYFVFKNIGGVYANWKTIVGNESGTYTCSTIAMNANGYIQFTRKDITQTLYKCSEWHVVAWVSDGSSQTTRLWIDAQYIGQASYMWGWADDTYLCRGPSWSFEDNNTVFKAIAIADSAHSDSDVVTNSNWLYTTYIDGGSAEKAPVYYFDGKSHTDNGWVDTASSRSMTAAKGSFVWEDDYLVLTKNTNYFNLPTDYGSYGAFEVLVKIDESFAPVSTTRWYEASCLFGGELGGTQRDWGIIIDRDGYFAIGHGNSSITSTDVIAADGKWHTLVMVVGPADIKLYIDGVLKKTVTITMSGTAISTFGVGWNAASANTSITGRIGTIKVWDTTLTDDEVLVSYEQSVEWLADFITNGAAIFVIENARYITSAVNSTINWTAVIPDGSSVKVFARLADGEFVECENGEAIPCIEEGTDLTNSVLEIKVELARDSLEVTPIVTSITIAIQNEGDDHIIVLEMGIGNTTNIQNAIGEVNVAYAGGSLIGEGGMVPNFDTSFLPEDLTYEGHQNDVEHIDVDIDATSEFILLTHHDTLQPENISVSIDAVSSLIHVDDI